MIPAWIVLYFLGYVAQIVMFFAWFIALFTGSLHEGLRDVLVYWIRYAAQTYGYQLLSDAEVPLVLRRLDDRDPDGRLPHGRRALPDRHRRRRASRRARRSSSAGATRSSGSTTCGGSSSTSRGATPTCTAATSCPGTTRRRSRGRVLPQRGVLDRLRARDDRARHLGARRGDRRAARGREPRRRRRSLRPARDRRGRSRRPRPLGHLPQRAVVRLGHGRPGRESPSSTSRSAARSTRRCASGWSRPSCRA